MSIINFKSNNAAPARRLIQKLDKQNSDLSNKLVEKGEGKWNIYEMDKIIPFI